MILAACSASFPACDGLARLPYMGTPVRSLGGTLARLFEDAKYPGQAGNRCSSSDGVASGFGGEGPAGRGGPPEGAAGQLVDRPAGVLLEPVITPALRAAVAQARPAACLVRGVVVVVALRGRPAAPGPGAGRVPHLGQVPAARMRFSMAEEWRVSLILDGRGGRISLR